ncbi:34060_t:CDS:2, partial [Racocetra persica]
LSVDIFIFTTLFSNYDRQHVQISNLTEFIQNSTKFNIPNSNEFNISISNKSNIPNSNKYEHLARHEEKFLAYLPHDGFNNQRIELENAIFLAWFLNRTLIIPPILYFTGVTPIIAQPYAELYNLLSHFMLPNNNFKENRFIFCFSEDETEIESLNIDPNTEVYNVSGDEYPYQEQYYDYSKSKTKLGKFKKR